MALAPELSFLSHPLCTFGCDWEVSMLIDCGTCVARETTACDDCIVTALCGDEKVVELADDERAAIDAMSSAGLISPIRLIRRPRDDGHRASGSRS